MRQGAWQEKESESEDKINYEKLHALQPVGPPVGRYLARDQNREEDDQDEASGEGQIHRGRTDEEARKH
jgi:hypothetical protein